MPINGLVTMTPTSTAKTGTGSSATINTNGSVTFSSCETLSLNGVFTSSYDNYMIVSRHVGSGGAFIYMRLRASGTDNSTASSYVTQQLQPSGAGLNPSRTTLTAGFIGWTGNNQRQGFTAYLFGPQLAQATAWRSVGVDDISNADLVDEAGTHNQATSYDGITIYPSGGSFSGLITVYGFNQ